MEINFEITNIPAIEQKKCMIAYLEGVLRISIGDNLFFNQPSILLVEFAICISRWLNKIHSGELSDLIYETMDYDEPIITIIHVNNTYFKIDSVWKEEGALPLIIKLNELISAFLKFLTSLSKKLKLKYAISLNEFI